MLPATNVQKECLFLLGTITNISCGKIVMSGEILVASVDDKSGTPLKCSKSTVWVPTLLRPFTVCHHYLNVSPLFSKNLISSTLHSAITSSGSHWCIFLLSSSNLSFLFSSCSLSTLKYYSLKWALSRGSKRWRKTAATSSGARRPPVLCPQRRRGADRAAAVLGRCGGGAGRSRALWLLFLCRDPSPTGAAAG